MLAGGRQKAARMPPIKRPHRSALRRPPPCLAKIILANLLSTFNQELVLKKYYRQLKEKYRNMLNEVMANNK